MAVVAPIPSAMVRRAVTVNPGLLRSCRMAYRKSCLRTPIHSALDIFFLLREKANCTNGDGCQSLGLLCRPQSGYCQPVGSGLGQPFSRPPSLACKAKSQHFTSLYLTYVNK